MQTLLDIVSNFETVLAAGITDTATSLTLNSATTDDGTTIPAGTYGFTIDEGTTLEEHVIGTVSSTSVTSLTRGVSTVDATTSITALKHPHKKGASIKITNHPSLMRILRVLNGTTGFDSGTPLFYDGAPTFTYGQNELVTWDKAKDYTDSVAIAGAPDADFTTKGIVEIATTAEIDAGTATGSTSASLAVRPDQLAASIYGTRLPSADEKAALAGTSGTPSASNKYVTNDDTVGTGSVIRGLKYGGDGSDGALTITSGATNIDLGGAQVVVKNYTSISITGTGSLTFSNPHANGTIVILKSQGNVTLTSSTAPMIAANAIGAVGGTAVTANATTVDGNNGTAGLGPVIQTGPGLGGDANSTGTALVGGIVSARQGVSHVDLVKYPQIFVGAGGGSGGADMQSEAVNNTSGKGGRGGGGLIIECAGAWNFTTAGGISVAGEAGGNAVGSPSRGYAQGGGGGGGGSLIATYNTLTANSGTVTVSGGAAGTGNLAAGAGTGANLGPSGAASGVTDGQVGDKVSANTLAVARAGKDGVAIVAANTLYN